MSVRRLKRPSSRQRMQLLGMTALLAGLGIFYFSVIEVQPHVTIGRAVAPWPDGPEYLDAAVALLRDGGYRIHIAGEHHPPRYPFGYSFLVAAALGLGVEPAAASYRVNQFAGLALLLLVAFALWRQERFVEAGLAVLLIASLPAHIILSRSPLSEVSGCVVVIAGVFLLYRYARDGGVLVGGLGAALLTMSVCFRISNVLLSPFIISAVAARYGRNWRPALKDLGVLGLFAIVGLAPLLLYNVAVFGSPIKTGYNYWIPYWNVQRSFNYRHVNPQLSYLWCELLEGKTRFTVADEYGGGSYFRPAFVVLSLVALLGIRHGRRFWIFVVAGLFYACCIALYFYRDARLIYPLLIMSAPVAAVGVASLWRQQKGRALALVTTFIFAVAVLGWPGKEGRLGLARFLWSAERGRTSSSYEAATQLAALTGSRSKLVFTDMPPPYIHAILPGPSLVAPLRDKHRYRFNPSTFFFDKRSRERLLARSLEEGKPVWIVTHKTYIWDVDRVLPPPVGFQWEVEFATRGRAGVAQLVRQTVEN